MRIIIIADDNGYLYYARLLTLCVSILLQGLVMTILKSSHIVSKKRATGMQLTATALSSAILLASAGTMAADEAKPAEAKKLDAVKVEADAIDPVY